MSVAGQAARHVCSGVREADVEVGADEVESWAETVAARAKAATVAKKRILKMLMMYTENNR